MKRPKRLEQLQYSEEFIVVVMAAFPFYERIQLMLNENPFSLGCTLSDGAIPFIDPALVVGLIEAGQDDKLLKIAGEAQER